MLLFDGVKLGLLEYAWQACGDWTFMGDLEISCLEERIHWEVSETDMLEYIRRTALEKTFKDSAIACLSSYNKNNLEAKSKLRLDEAIALENLPHRIYTLKDSSIFIVLKKEPLLNGWNLVNNMQYKGVLHG
jgi:hypothetical protein